MSPNADVLVVGAGACGLIAALRAAQSGASVAVLEKLDRFAGNTTLSCGSIPAAGTKLQRAAGITDDTGVMMADMDGFAFAERMRAQDPAVFAPLLAAPHRSPGNVARDRFRHPAETLAFFGVRADSTVHKGRGYEAQYTVIPSLTFSEQDAGRGIAGVVSSIPVLRDIAALLEADGIVALYLGAADAAAVARSPLFQWRGAQPIPHSDSRVILIGTPIR